MKKEGKGTEKDCNRDLTAMDLLKIAVPDENERRAILSCALCRVAEDRVEIFIDRESRVPGRCELDCLVREGVWLFVHVIGRAPRYIGKEIYSFDLYPEERQADAAFHRIAAIRRADDEFVLRNVSVNTIKYLSDDAWNG